MKTEHIVLIVIVAVILFIIWNNKCNENYDDTTTTLMSFPDGQGTIQLIPGETDVYMLTHTNFNGIFKSSNSDRTAGTFILLPGPSSSINSMASMINALVSAMGGLDVNFSAMFGSFYAIDATKPVTTPVISSLAATAPVPV